MELQDFEEFLERKDQLTIIQANILQSDHELLTKYAAYVTKTKDGHLNVINLCQSEIGDYDNKAAQELAEKIGDFSYEP